MLEVTVRSIADGKQCGLRSVLDTLGDKWTFLILTVLEDKPRRFNQIKRQIGDISQRVLSMRLHDLERDGYVQRKVLPFAPPQVEYALTKMGLSALIPVTVLLKWALASNPEIERSRNRYDLAKPARQDSVS